MWANQSMSRLYCKQMRTNRSSIGVEKMRTSPRLMLFIFRQIFQTVNYRIEIVTCVSSRKYRTHPTKHSRRALNSVEKWVRALCAKSNESHTFTINYPNLDRVFWCRLSSRHRQQTTLFINIRCSIHIQSVYCLGILWMLSKAANSMVFFFSLAFFFIYSPPIVV